LFDVSKINEWFDRGESPGEIFPILSFFEGSSIVRLKSGGYAVLFELAGIDGDGMSRATLDEISHQLRNILNALPNGCQVYSYRVSRQLEAIPRVEESGEALIYRNHRVDHLNRSNLKAYSLYACLYLPGPKFVDKLSVVDYGDRKTAQLRKMQAGSQLFLRQMNGAVCTTRMCSQDETVTFFSFLQTLDLRRVTRRLPRGCEVSHKLCGAEISWQPLRIGKQYLKTFALMDRPDGTRPNLFSGLMGLKSSMVLCSIWRPRSSGEIRDKVKEEEHRKGFEEISWVDAAGSHFGGDPMAQMAVARSSAQKIANEKSVDLLADVLSDLSTYRQGEYSVYGFLYGEDHEALEGDLINLETVFLNPSNARVIVEQTGAMSAYLSIFPGNDPFARRRFWLRDDHVANLAPIYKPNNGTFYSPDIDNEWTQVYETPNRTPFFMASFYDQSGNMIVNGSVRRGKSLNVNYLVLGEAKFNGYVYIFDVGGSYDYTVQMLGGACTKVGLDGPRWAPFAEPYSKDAVNVILRLVRGMLERGGVQVDHTAEAVILSGIEKVYASDESIRSLSLLKIFLGDLGCGLDKWTGDGLYAALFDNVANDFSLAKIQSFDFTQITGNTYKDVLELVFFWIVYQIGKIVRDPANLGVPKLTVAEEIWKHMRTPAMVDYILDSLKADPKNLGRLIVVMHSHDDLGSFARQIRAVCPLTMFFGGNTSDPGFRDFYGLNQSELDVIESLAPPRLAFKVDGQNGFFKELELNLDGRFLAMFTTTPREKQLRNELTKLHGYRAALAIMGERMGEIRQLSAASGK
jgi:type IV secretion system protein VirB4